MVPRLNHPRRDGGFRSCSARHGARIVLIAAFGALSRMRSRRRAACAHPNFKATSSLHVIGRLPSSGRNVKRAEQAASSAAEAVPWGPSVASRVLLLPFQRRSSPACVGRSSPGAAARPAAGPQSGSAWHVRRAGARQASQAVFGVAIASLSALTDVLIVLPGYVRVCRLHGSRHPRWYVPRSPPSSGRACSLRTSSRRDRISLGWLRTGSALSSALSVTSRPCSPINCSSCRLWWRGHHAVTARMLATTTSASTVAAGMPAAFSDLATAAGSPSPPVASLPLC